MARFVSEVMSNITVRNTNFTFDDVSLESSYASDVAYMTAIVVEQYQTQMEISDMIRDYDISAVRESYGEYFAVQEGSIKEIFTRIKDAIVAFFRKVKEFFANLFEKIFGTKKKKEEELDKAVEELKAAQNDKPIKSISTASDSDSGAHDQSSTWDGPSKPRSQHSNDRFDIDIEKKEITFKKIRIDTDFDPYSIVDELQRVHAELNKQVSTDAQYLVSHETNFKLAPAMTDKDILKKIGSRVGLSADKIDKAPSYGQLLRELAPYDSPITMTLPKLIQAAQNVKNTFADDIAKLKKHEAAIKKDGDETLKRIDELEKAALRADNPTQSTQARASASMVAKAASNLSTSTTNCINMATLTLRFAVKFINDTINEILAGKSAYLSAYRIYRSKK